MTVFGQRADLDDESVERVKEPPTAPATPYVPAGMRPWLEVATRAVAALERIAKALEPEIRLVEQAPEPSPFDDLKLPYGRAKGQTVRGARTKDLEWVLGTLDAEKLADEKYGQSNRELATAIEDELARRRSR